MEKTKCFAKLDARAVAHSHLPDDIIHEKIAFHTNVVSFLDQEQGVQPWSLGEVNPRVRLIAAYINEMCAAETPQQTVIRPDQLEHLYTYHFELSGRQPAQAFSLTALSALSYAVDQLRKIDNGPLTTYLCQEMEVAPSELVAA